jgi:hypothetical protein
VTNQTFAACILFCLGLLRADSARAVETNYFALVQQLLQDNAAMRSQIQNQERTITALTIEVAAIEKSNSARDDALNQIKDSKDDAPPPGSSGFNSGRVRISGEGGVGFFESGSDGQFPNAGFRVDEAKLFVDASVWNDVYAFAELNLATRESSDVSLQLGEAYVDFENVSKLWHRDSQLNIRAGRMDIPFGEEYLTRDAIDNPLISHSLTDFWGVDEGVEIYGALGKFSYVAAVQNGGISDTADFNADKSVAARVSYDPSSRLHLSVSAMRTGALDAQRDKLSALWFGNGFFRSLGSTNTTAFHANVIEGDVSWRLPRGHISAVGGAIFYGDNDPARNNSRDVYYYSIEAVHDLTRKIYAAARFSQIFARNGFPIVADGQMHDYLFGDLTTEIWRLSLGLGYRWNQHLAIKTEYTLERGKTSGGEHRDHEDLFATEAVFGF